MTRRRIILRTGLLLVLCAALLPLFSSARAGQGAICCSDVKFPEVPYGYGSSGPGQYLVVDGIGHGVGVYRTIQEAINDAPRHGAQILVKPNQSSRDGGVYVLEDPLLITKPVTITAFGSGDVVRIMADHRVGGEDDASCAVIDLRRDGKVVINGLSFMTSAERGACIKVEHASEFALTASDITAVDNPSGAADEDHWCAPRNSGPRPRMNCGLVGVYIQSGLATIQGNRIRRTGTAIALASSPGEAHRVQGNYLAGNGIGVYVTNGSKFDIEHNGIFRNHEYGLILEDGLGVVSDNDIEDNYTGLKIVPPSAFSGSAASRDGGTAYDYSDMSRHQIRIERNLITQYGVYRPYGKNLYGGHYWTGPTGPENSGYDTRGDHARDDHSHDGAERLAQGEDNQAARFGYALDFGLTDEYLQDNVYDYPKRGSVLSGVSISQNCFFGPATSWFDRDRFMRLIAPSKPGAPDGGYDSGKDSGYAPFGRSNGGAYKENGYSIHNNDALTPLFDVNTWVEHLDYDGVDKIDHDNSIRSPRYDGFSGGLWTAIHNWFARNKKDMVCTFRYSEPVVGAPGDWPRFDTHPVH